MQVHVLAYEKGLLGLVLATFAVLGLGIVRGETSIDSFLQLRQSRKVLRTAVDDLKKENATLHEEILKLKDSPSYARKVLRDKYHVLEEDEDIMFFAE